MSTEAAEVPNFDSPDFIDSIVEEISSGEKQEQATETATEDKTGDQTNTTEETKTEDKIESEPQISPQLAAMARRERQLRQEQEAYKTSREQDLADAKAEVLKELLSNPQGFIQKHKIEKPADLAMQFYAAELGDDAPDELKKFTAKSEYTRQVAEVQSRIDVFERKQIEKEKQLAAQAYISEMSGFMQGDLSTEFPYLAAEITADREEALNIMIQAADQLLQGANSVPSVRQVAQVLETEYTKLAAKYGSVQTTPANVTTEPNTATKTISNNLAGQAPQNEDMTDEDYRKAALKWLVENRS